MKIQLDINNRFVFESVCLFICLFKSHLKMDDQMMQEQEKDQFCDFLVPPSLGNRVSEFQQLNLKYSYSGISNASSSNDFMLTTARSFTQDFSPKLIFVQSSQLYETITKWSEELEKRMMIDCELIVYLLYMHKWNQDKLNDVYYDKLVGEFGGLNSRLKQWRGKRKRDGNSNDNGKSQQMRQEGQSDGSEMANCNQDERKQQQSALTLYGDCEICCQQHIQLYCTAFCQHKYCKQCWSQYIKQNLYNNNIFFTCMNIQCNHYPVLPQVVQHIASELYQLYKKKICVNYAIVNKSVSYCPNESCDLFCEKPSIVEQNYVECPCGRMYCFKCEKQPHEPATCFQVEKWGKLTNQQRNNQLWIQKFTRKCPRCKQHVQKYIGCNHVKCICGCQFCFNCNSIWDEHHSSSTQCNNTKHNNNNNIKLTHQQQQQKTAIQSLTDKLIYISRSINKDMVIIKHTLELLAKQQSLHYLRDLFQDIKAKVHHAWTNIKWTIVALYLRHKPSIQIEIQKDSIHSIQNLMETVTKIQKKISTYNYDNLLFSHFLYLDSKELLHLKEQLFKRKQALNKTMEVWTEAWRNIAGDY